jgi:putative ABC transport system permease protein
MTRSVEILVEGFRHVRRHPLRSLLTASTSAVAIAVTVNVISLVYGLDADVRRDVERFGRLTIDVGRFPVIGAGARQEPLGPAERRQVEEALSDLSPVVVPRRQVAGQAQGDREVERIPVVAVGPAYLETLEVPLLAGRFFEGDEDPGAVAVLDRSASVLLFPDVLPGDVVGRVIEVETPLGRSSRRVLGVLADPLTYRAVFESFDEGRGARTLTSGLLSFRNIYVPASALGGGEYAGISLALRSEADVEEAARRLRTIWIPRSSDPLQLRPGVGVFVRREWMNLLGQTTQTGAFLGNVVWIIVVGVAVVMISTLNLLTIRERYDELAIRRCEGARRGDVALQITAEGTLLAFLGGVAGLPLGYLGSDVLSRLVQFPFRFEARYAVAATGVSILLGLLASVLPARRAAGLEPARVLSRRLT